MRDRDAAKRDDAVVGQRLLVGRRERMAMHFDVMALDVAARLLVPGGGDAGR
jgi:hypothetical protein